MNTPWKLWVKKEKKIKIKDGEEICPHCGMILRGYEGLRHCYCKFCGGAISR